MGGLSGEVGEMSEGGKDIGVYCEAVFVLMGS